MKEESAPRHDFTMKDQTPIELKLIRFHQDSIEILLGFYWDSFKILLKMISI